MNGSEKNRTYHGSFVFVYGTIEQTEHVTSSSQKRQPRIYENRFYAVTVLITV